VLFGCVLLLCLRKHGLILALRLLRIHGDESQNVSVCNSITYASVWNYYIRHHMKGRTKYIIYASAMKSLKYIKNHFVVEGDQENEKKGNEI
jgi:hypothetical protein